MPIARHSNRSQHHCIESNRNHHHSVGCSRSHARSVGDIRTNHRGFEGNRSRHNSVESDRTSISSRTQRSHTPPMGRGVEEENMGIPNDLSVLHFIPEEPNVAHHSPSACFCKRLKTWLCVVCQLLFIALLLHVFFVLYHSEETFGFAAAPGEGFPNSFRMGQGCNLNAILKEFAEIKHILKDIQIVKSDVAFMKSKIDDLNLQESINSAIEVYDADKIGIVDYALEYTGGYVTAIPDTIPYPSNMAIEVLGLLSLQYSSNPRTVIQPFNLPGQCFAFHGTQGKIRIRLAEEINVTSVTMEHAHLKLLPDYTSAPKEFAVYGFEDIAGSIGQYLGKFTFNISRGPLQTFNITHEGGEVQSYRVVELWILSNYGNPHFTCVYRFRVHGNATGRDIIE